MTKLRFKAGLLKKKKCRLFLEKSKFNGMNINYFEEKYLLSSVFIIKGNFEDIEKIRKVLG